MKYTTTTPAKSSANAVILYMFEDDKSLSSLFKYYDKLSNGAISKQIFENMAFSAKYNTLFKYAVSKDLLITFVGLGKKKLLTKKLFSQAVSSVSRTVKSSESIQTLGFELFENDNITLADCAYITVTASRIGLYEFNKYTKNKENILHIELISDSMSKEIENSAKVGAAAAYAMKFTKDLVNDSASVVTPEYIASLASEIAKEYKLEARIMSKPEIEKMNMNAFLAVARGSANEPRFIHLTYKPKTKAKRKIALVGKGITFDAGGLDIKPASSMVNMKDDMTGAASVLGIIQAVSKLKLDVELHCICALCENMPSGTSYKQGDILTAMNGKTIEVDNTDAEGRITLADALSYCDKLDVDEVIDIATLTGAVIVALGTNITGVLGNNQRQIDKFIKTASASCENVWQMPILDELKDNLKSDVADFKNTGGRNAGTSTAGWFLSNFTSSKSWMHLDIAGTAYLDKSNKETLSGPTGVMIRSLINYLAQ